MNKTKENYSILFVEDEEDIRANYMRYLKRHFHNVYEAANGEAGLNIYRQKRPDIMIVDINLPKLNGLELVRIVRESDHMTRVLMLTAHSDIEYLLKATELKLTKYLIKPITREQLKEALLKAIDELSKFDITSKKIVSIKDSLIWNIDREELYDCSAAIPLTNKEKIMLKQLILNRNITQTYYDLIAEMWDNCDNSKIDALKTIIKNLRKKLPKDTIVNTFGVGYKINLS